MGNEVSGSSVEVQAQPGVLSSCAGTHAAPAAVLSPRLRARRSEVLRGLEERTEIPEGLLVSRLMKRSGVSSMSAQCICAEVFSMLDEETLQNTLRNRVISGEFGPRLGAKEHTTSQDLSEISHADALLHSPRTSARRLTVRKPDAALPRRRVAFREGPDVVIARSDVYLAVSPRSSRDPCTLSLEQALPRSVGRAGGPKEAASSKTGGESDPEKRALPPVTVLELSSTSDLLPNHFLTLSPTTVALHKRRAHKAEL
mmetsp:Transcript_15650/g.42167  ORF Transcript_15650/g.42167 Transcript_15650/m.42167 type:complete len:257 (-) Transcript_15650:202-972(-)